MSSTNGDIDNKSFQEVLESMKAGIDSTRETIKNMSSQLDLDTKDGISLLSLKHHLMLSYMQSLVLLSAHRLVGHTLGDRSAEARQPFSSTSRNPRGSQPGNLVDSMIENRIVLEKIKALENKMRYQIDKLVRLADETPAETARDVINDPLAFRPNPQDLLDQASDDSNASGADDNDEEGEKGRDGIYRPPRVAPVPYVEASGSRGKKERQRPIPMALAQLSHLGPHAETTSGLGGTPALQSARAKELQRMTEFEEENFTRLVMKKKDARRRKQDEEDIALGGSGTGSVSRGRGRRGVGFEDEFADVLKSVGRKRDSFVGDGYEELRQRGKKSDTLTRARTRKRDEIEDTGIQERKKGRFEKERNSLRKKLNGKTKRT